MNQLKKDTVPFTYKEKEVTYFAVPISDEKRIRGVLLVKAEQANVDPLSKSLPFMFLFLGVSFVVFFVGAAIVGITFGVITSRNLINRLQKILISSDRWSQGDFTTLIKNTSHDEIGQVAERLNQREAGKRSPIITLPLVFIFGSMKWRRYGSRSDIC